jgi:hypothetical protein
MSRREIPLADRLAALREAVEVAEGRLEVPEVGSSAARVKLSLRAAASKAFSAFSGGRRRGMRGARP